MRDPAPQTILLKDYLPPCYTAREVELDFDIRLPVVTVIARTLVQRTREGTGDPLVLSADELEMVSVAIDGEPLAPHDYQLTSDALTIAPDRLTPQFTIEIITRLAPETNSKLMGLYASKDGLFTQCEAEGFRRITYALDRPDVMARYSVTLHADKAAFPVLLSNGNITASGDESSGRHWARWEDPFPKPSYLFALVAARLDVLADTFVTRSGRKVDLYVYVESGKVEQCTFAMEALKKAARWDENVFGLELDLDRYSIVAVGDFNMGAMENKGLNIFNTKYVLARPDVATDKDFENIDRVVAHEYFHNWTGNRVTCRDWFQLSLKEGLTVFRDQEFGADMYSRPVQRIQEVRNLRGSQFPEDASPMAHPIRPETYMEISNFYTATVYEKGAEVVRMIHTLIGKQAFRAGMDLYFKRHDGHAVTTEDFVAAMADASGVDLTQFKLWYSQAGTPNLAIAGTYDAAHRTYTLDVRQSCPQTAYDRQSSQLGPDGQPRPKQPMHIPLSVGLVGKDGRDLAFQVGPAATAATTSGAHTQILSVTQAEQRFVLNDVAEPPTPSLLRDFSAPVILEFQYSDEQLARLMAHDSNAFCRWEAGQTLATRIILSGVQAVQRGQSFALPDLFAKAVAGTLAAATADPAFAAESLSLPSETFLAERMTVVDPEALHRVRTGLRQQLAQRLRGEFLSLYHRLSSEATYSPDAQSAGRRALRNAALGFLMELSDDPATVQLCVAQFQQADNMTDMMGALGALTQADVPARAQALTDFLKRWEHEALVVDKWFMLQAVSRLPDTLQSVRKLMSHPLFDLRNPNRVRSLVSSFCSGNHRLFHAADGSGYDFCADQVITLDRFNPQVAARLARAFDRWPRFDAQHQRHAKAALERVRQSTGLSRDVFEVVSRALAV